MYVYALLSPPPQPRIYFLAIAFKEIIYLGTVLMMPYRNKHMNVSHLLRNMVVYHHL